DLLEATSGVVKTPEKAAVGENHSRLALSFITGFLSAVLANACRSASSALRSGSSSSARLGTILKRGRPPLLTRISSPRAVRAVASWQVSRTSSVTVIVVIIDLSYD